MRSIEEIMNYKPHIDLLDPFGLGQMREILYDCKIHLSNLRGELAEKDEVIAHQARALDVAIQTAIRPELELQLRAKKLEHELEKSKKSEQASWEFCDALTQKYEELKKNVMPE